MRVAGLIVEDPIERSAVGLLDVLFPESHRLETQTLQDEILEYSLVETACGFPRARSDRLIHCLAQSSLVALRIFAACHWLQTADFDPREGVG